MGLFKKRKDKKPGVYAILCNSSILTSNQIKEALESELNQDCEFVDFYITQFPWDAEDQLKKHSFDFLFIDEVTETAKDVERILSRIRKDNENIKIIMFSTYVSDLTLRLSQTKTIDAYVLMPFQPSHVVHAVSECMKTESEESIEI